MIHNDNTSKVAAVICEYNPFHAGHAYHLAQTRSLGATHIVAIMSGSFVQRGEPAMFSKWSRAKCALACGADLVLELPLPWCMSSAEGFARGLGSRAGLCGSAQLRQRARGNLSFAPGR